MADEKTQLRSYIAEIRSFDPEVFLAGSAIAESEKMFNLMFLAGSGNGQSEQLFNPVYLAGLSGKYLTAADSDKEQLSSRVEKPKPKKLFSAADKKMHLSAFSATVPMNLARGSAVTGFNSSDNKQAPGKAELAEITDQEFYESAGMLHLQADFDISNNRPNPGKTGNLSDDSPAEKMNILSMMADSSPDSIRKVNLGADAGGESIGNLQRLASVACKLKMTSPLKFLSLKGMQRRRSPRARRNLMISMKLVARTTRIQRIANMILQIMGSSSFVTEKQVRELIGNNPDTSKALRLLLKERRVKRTGIGGKYCPFRYRMNAPESYFDSE